MTDITRHGRSQDFFLGFARVSGGYWTEAGGWRPRVVAAVLALIIVAQVALAIRLNVWSADLFDALQRRSTDSAVPGGADPR
jgi:putative ATP-binding cassette transporter